MPQTIDCSYNTHLPTFVPITTFLQTRTLMNILPIFGTPSESRCRSGAGRDGAASHPLHGTPTSSRRRSRSPLRRPLSVSRSPPSRAHAPFSRTALPESCLTIYNQVKNRDSPEQRRKLSQLSTSRSEYGGANKRSLSL